MSGVMESSQVPVQGSEIVEAAMRPLRKAGRRFWIAIAVLSVIVAFGIVAWIYQLQQGMAVAGYSDRSFWAIYIADVVAFIGVSYGGAVVSAVMLLTGMSWRAPLARLSEGMALVTVLIGAAFIIPHLGRPDRILGMVTHPNFTSPVFWDMVAIVTYAFATFVFFLLPLIPDTAILRGAHPDDLGRGRLFVYRLISRNWRGSKRERSVLRSATVIVAIIIIPLAVSVHSVLAWAFSLMSRPGWHESIWAPYFVIAALYSGVALVVVVIAGFRRGYHLEGFITQKHFVSLGLIMASLGAVYFYLTFADLLPSGYVSETGPNEVIYAMLVGDLALSFWLFLVAGVIVPIVLIALPWTRNIRGIVIAAVLVVIAMWIKRVVMVVETSGYDRLTYSFGDYFDFTWVSIAVTLAGAAAIPLFLMLLFRIVPVLAIDEMAELSGHPISPGVEDARGTKPGRGKAVGVAGMVIAALVGLGAIGVGTAQPAQAKDASPAAISVKATTSGPEVTIVATVTAGGEPVAEAPVSFYQSTPMFAPGDNRVSLGEVATDSGGTAELTYLATEPGQVTISVVYYASIGAEPVTAETPLRITEFVSPYVAPAPRLLGSIGSALVIALFSLVLIVFVLVVAQVVRVRRASSNSADATEEGATSESAAI